MNKMNRRLGGQACLILWVLIATLAGSAANAAVVDYQRTVVISPVGPTAVDNGTALLLGLSAIAGGVPAPSASDRYLLKLEPGVYDVGTTAVQLPPYVDLEGSGEAVTLIRGAVDGAFAGGLGLVTVASNTELRRISVENNADGPAIDSAAVLLLGGSKASHVSAIATGSSTINRALMVALDVDPKPVVSDITATAATRAVQVLFPGLEAENLVAEGTQGLLVSSGNVFIRNSRISGSDFSMLVANLSETVDFVTTQLAGPKSCTSNNCRCFASYNANLKELKRSCKKKK